MRLRKLHVDHFGAWHNFTLSVAPKGLTLIYGPNEAGKTTLMRFLRGVLYGFPRDVFAASSTDTPDVWRGTLELDHNGQTLNLHRVAERGESGRLDIVPMPSGRSAEEFRSEIVSGTTQNIFESVFAIGLSELQELSTLDDGRVTRLIYSLSQGNSSAELDRLLREFESEAGAETDLEPLRTREAECLDRLTRWKHARDRFDDATRTKREIAEELDKLEQEREQLLATRSRWEAFCRLKKPFDRWMQLRSGSATEQPPMISREVVEEFDQLTADLDEAKALRRDLQSEAKRLRDNTRSATVTVPVGGEDRHAAMRTFVAQRDWIGSLEQRHQQSVREADKRRNAFQELHRQLGSDIGADRWTRADTTPEGLDRLLRAVQKYRKTLSRRTRLRSRYDRYSQKYNVKSAELNRLLSQTGEHSLAEAIAERQQRLDQYRELERLLATRRELSNRSMLLTEEVHRIDVETPLPGWINLVLSAFILVGLIVACAGYWRGVQSSMLAGMLYCLLGLTGVGLLWGVRSWLATRDEESYEERMLEREELEVALRSNQAQVQQMLEAIGLDLEAFDLTTPEQIEALDLPGRMRVETEAILELERLGERDASLQKLRRGLSGLRKTHQERQRELNPARETWIQTLTELGLPETVDTNEAIGTWITLADLDRAWTAWKQAETEATHWRQQHEQVKERMRAAATSEGEQNGDYSHLVKVLDRWSSRLGKPAAVPSREQTVEVEPSAAWTEAEAKLEEANDLEELCEQLTQNRAEILIGASVKNRDELVARTKAPANGSQQNSPSVEAAEANYRQVRKSLSDPLPNEDQLRLVEAAIAERELKQATDRLAEIDRLTKQHLQKQEQLEQELRTLKAPGDENHWRAELERTRRQIADLTAEREARRLTIRALESLRDQMSGDRQPSVLDTASRYLARMTTRQLLRFHANGEQRTLRVEDAHGQHIPVEQLSSGSREQVFLALRLAIVEQLIDEGISLPLVLDDVLVNFDHERTEAVIETLIDFAERGHQVLLFTCHQHLSDLVRSKGHTPIALPRRTAEITDSLSVPETV